MRITSKEQVTIPVDICEWADFCRTPKSIFSTMAMTGELTAAMEGAEAHTSSPN